MYRRLFLALPGGLFAAPAVDVAAIDRGRILKAADGYLKEKPVTVTASSSPRSAGASTTSSAKATTGGRTRKTRRRRICSAMG